MKNEPDTLNKFIVGVWCHAVEDAFILFEYLGVSIHPDWKSEVDNDCIRDETWYLYVKSLICSLWDTAVSEEVVFFEEVSQE